MTDNTGQYTFLTFIILMMALPFYLIALFSPNEPYPKRSVRPASVERVEIGNKSLVDIGG